MRKEYIDVALRDTDLKSCCYQIYNEWMVEHSARVIAVWNGSSSGTKNTVIYAKRKGVSVINVLDK